MLRFYSETIRTLGRTVNVLRGSKVQGSGVYRFKVQGSKVEKIKDKGYLLFRE